MRLERIREAAIADIQQRYEDGEIDEAEAAQELVDNDEAYQSAVDSLAEDLKDGSDV